MERLAFQQKAIACGIPEHGIEPLTEYIYDRRPPGSFLISVLSNDLAGAVGRADNINAQALSAYVICLYNYAPASCWGSSDAVENWLRG